MNKTRIFVTAYPKSGSTWLTRLLADVLNCPAGGSHPSEDKKELASEGWDRPEPYVVCKGHYRINKAGALNPRPHELNTDLITDDHVVHLVRDPRDIAVSAALYHEKDLSEIIAGMVQGSLYGLPPWAAYVDRWRRLILKNNRPVLSVMYEEFLRHTGREVEILLRTIGIPFDLDRLPDAVHRQGFTQRLAQISGDTKMAKSKRNLNAKLMRHGVAGDWRKHFSTKQLDWVMRYWQHEMELLGYER